MQNIVILDFGSQTTQLIARRIRSLDTFCEILPYNAEFEQIKARRPCGIILSGGPASVYDTDAPKCDARILDLNIPILGVCYGFQLLSVMLGGEVQKAERREFGQAKLRPSKQYELLKDTDLTVWMSHGDKVTKLAPGWECVAVTDTCENAIAVNSEKKLAGVQFHPEVTHSLCGQEIISDFVDHCESDRSWKIESIRDMIYENIRSTVGDEQVLCALSGGVDSCVVAKLIHDVIGNRLKCVFVDNGLLRHDEHNEIFKYLHEMFGECLVSVDASKTFNDALDGVSDPEMKRKIIGSVFIDVFKSVIAEDAFSNCRWLAQGTLYPDVIESISVNGPSSVIKSHHNVGGLPEKLGFKLLEPLRMMFKDEVRALGKIIGIPSKVINRQPFPGPGLAIRIIGAITKEKIDLVRKADRIVREEICEAGLQETTWQAFASLLPVQSVGVMGDHRTYESMCCVRIVQSEDGMTASVPWPTSTLEKIASRIVNEVRGINRVVYDITSKPPGTIELE